MMRAIGDLAPRNAVVALEGAVRDLTDRVALLRQDGHSELLLAPLELTAAELCKTLKSHDPAAVAAGLETELRGLRGKIDELAKAAINPETFERLRLQTEELRALLVSAAARTPPVERLERQIGDLADRVERLGESLSPHVESAADGRLARRGAQGNRTLRTAAGPSVDRASSRTDCSAARTGRFRARFKMARTSAGSKIWRGGSTPFANRWTPDRNRRSIQAGWKRR